MHGRRGLSRKWMAEEPDPGVCGRATVKRPYLCFFFLFRADSGCFSRVRHIVFVLNERGVFCLGTTLREGGGGVGGTGSKSLGHLFLACVPGNQA